MKRPGPPLESLIDRLIAIPDEFVKIASGDYDSIDFVSIPALTNDMMLDNGGAALSDGETSRLSPSKTEIKTTDKTGSKTKKNDTYPGIISILCYIYEDKFFTQRKTDSELIKNFILSDTLIELTRAVDSAYDFINDPDRREEICRLALHALNYIPMGENENNSADRLLTLNSVERKKILIKTAEAQSRAKQLREAMQKQEAEEAASKMSRE